MGTTKKYFFYINYIMDQTFAITGKNCVILCADTSVIKSIFAYKHNQVKYHILSRHQIMLLEGDGSDCSNFGEYIKQNIRLFNYRNGKDLSTHGMANFMRGQLAEAIRKAPQQVNALLGGIDKENNDNIPRLYSIDYMG